jgi:hypothetical protein
MPKTDYLGIIKTRSIPLALLQELRINGLCSTMIWTILICLAGVDTTVSYVLLDFNCIYVVAHFMLR